MAHQASKLVEAINPSAVRRIYIYDKHEAVNSNFQKVTKRGAFPNNNSVRNQLLLNNRLAFLFDNFDR